MYEEKFKAAEQKAKDAYNKVDRRMEPIIHGDVPSFMNLPIARSKEDLEGCDVAIIGIPYEGSKLVTPYCYLPYNAKDSDEEALQIYARCGAQLCPDAVRRNSIHYNMEQGDGYFPEAGDNFCIMHHIKAADYRDAPIDKSKPVEDIMCDIRNKVKDIYNAGAIPIVIGGDHTIPAPVFEALAETTDGNFGIIDFDSHFDMSYTPKYWAGSQWARCFETGKVKPENFVQIGIRGIRQNAFWQYVQESLGYKYFTIRDIAEQGIQTIVQQAIDIASNGTSGVYVSLDYDCLDAALAPGQKYPDVAGITTREIMKALRMIVSQVELKGFDVCCMSPKYDINNLGAQVIGRAGLEIMSAIAEKKAVHDGIKG